MRALRKIRRARRFVRFAYYQLHPDPAKRVDPADWSYLWRLAGAMVRWDEEDRRAASVSTPHVGGIRGAWRGRASRSRV